VEEATLGPYEFGVVLKGGTSTTAVMCVAGVSTPGPSLFRWGVARVELHWSVWMVVKARCWVLREQPVLGVLLHDESVWSVEPPRELLFGGVWGRRRCDDGDRSLFENCTVDASIF